MGFPFVTRYGNIIVRIMASATYDFLVPMCAVAELVALGYIYGIKNFVKDVNLMFGRNTESWQVGPWIWKSPVKC